MNYHPKVFGIGLSKTGTTSLHKALQILGYRSCHYPILDNLNEILSVHDAATDTTIACSFKKLDLTYPGSKFILTVRETASWIKSAAHEFKDRSLKEPWKQQVRLQTYGSLEWNPETYLMAYEHHINNVLDYFSGRPNDLLIMDIMNGEGWPALCHFLQRPIPDLSFPWENQTDLKQ